MKSKETIASRRAKRSIIIGGIGALSLIPFLLFFPPLVILYPFMGIPGLVMAVLSQTKNKPGESKKLSWIGIGIALIPMMVFIGVLIWGVVKLYNEDPSFRYSGTNAINNMTRQQRNYFDTHIAKINKDSTLADVTNILGSPVRNEYVQIYSMDMFSYTCPEELIKNCRVHVTFNNKKINSVLWADEKRFVYRKDFLDFFNFLRIN